MKRAGQYTKKTTKFGDMELDVTDKYKCLGQLMKNKGNLKGHMDIIKRKQKQHTKNTSNSRERHVPPQRDGSLLENTKNQCITNPNLQ